MALRTKDPGFADHAQVEEVVAMGADAIAVAIFVKNDDEFAYLKRLANTVREAERFGLPVIPHIYPLVDRDGTQAISNTPEDVFYAVRVGLEMGADVIKAPYTGDVPSFADIVADTPVPVVTAGGPQCETLDEALAMLRDIVESGAAGTTIGRNVWGFPDVSETIRQMKAALGLEA
jgi:class I fructose-bisphosphate aldolase